jgi:hypothetical protein
MAGIDLYLDPTKILPEDAERIHRVLRDPLDEL